MGRLLILACEHFKGKTIKARIKLYYKENCLTLQHSMAKHSWKELSADHLEFMNSDNSFSSSKNDVCPIKFSKSGIGQVVFKFPKKTSREMIGYVKRSVVFKMKVQIGPKTCIDILFVNTTQYRGDLCVKKSVLCSNDDHFTMSVCVVNPWHINHIYYSKFPIINIISGLGTEQKGEVSLSGKAHRSYESE